jgi:hypothetical protein
VPAEGSWIHATVPISGAALMPWPKPLHFDAEIRNLAVTDGLGFRATISGAALLNRVDISGTLKNINCNDANRLRFGFHSGRVGCAPIASFGS